MAVQAPPLLSVEQYLAWEEDNLEKHEYIDGDARCMAGANRRHIGMVWNIANCIGSQIDESRCSVLIAEMKVKSAGPRGIYYLYPDICFVCGEERYESASEVVLLNPDVVVEVTSAATRGYDRSEKRDLYFAIPSIQAYLIIDQHQIHAELHTRRRLDWQIESFSSLDDIISLPIMDCSLPLARAYRGIETDR